MLSSLEHSCEMEVQRSLQSDSSTHVPTIREDQFQIRVHQVGTAIR